MTNRREFVLAAMALWDAALVRAQEHQHHSAAAAGASTPYRFVFLTPAMRSDLRRAMAILIPADERSGGAVGAKVDEYIDFVISHADVPLQEVWRSGLTRLGKAQDLDAFLLRQAQHEYSPRTEDEEFFVLLKQAVTAGFYTSAEGIEKELGYQGMAFALDFEGCSHEGHTRPDDWKPVLRQKD